jgi:hypothetical protein
MEEQNALSTVFQKEHYAIATNFVNRIMEILGNGTGKVRTYGVDCGSYTDTEKFILEINDKTTLDIQISVRK